MGSELEAMLKSLFDNDDDDDITVLGMGGSIIGILTLCCRYSYAGYE